MFKERHLVQLQVGNIIKKGVTGTPGEFATSLLGESNAVEETIKESEEQIGHNIKGIAEDTKSAASKTLGIPFKIVAIPVELAVNVSERIANIATNTWDRAMTLLTGVGGAIPLGMTKVKSLGRKLLSPLTTITGKAKKLAGKIPGATPSNSTEEVELKKAA